jgi:hypothetical protein
MQFHHHQTLVYSLGLSVCLRMVDSACKQLSVAQSEQFFSEVASEYFLYQIPEMQAWHAISPPHPETVWPHHEQRKGCLSGIKCAYFKNLSTTTNMVLNPSDFGSPSIKSVEMSCHAPLGTCKGCSSPVVCVLSCLTC